MLMMWGFSVLLLWPLVGLFPADAGRGKEGKWCVQKLVRFLSVEQVSAFSGYELLQIEGLVVGNVFCLVQRQGAFGQGQHV